MATDPNLSKIIAIVLEATQPRQIILFGSRARQTAHPYADYDIALDGPPLSFRMVRNLKDALDERLGIFSVDLIFLAQVDIQFEKIVRQEGVVIYDADRDVVCTGSA